MKYFAIVCGPAEVPDHFDTMDAAWAYCYRLQRERIINNFMVYPSPDNKTIPELMKAALRMERIKNICQSMEYLGKVVKVRDVDELADMTEEQLSEVEMIYHQQMEALILQLETPML